MRSIESKDSLDTRSSFKGTPTKRRTSASAWGVTPGPADGIRHAVGDAAHQHAVALGERKRQLALDLFLDLGVHDYLGGGGAAAPDPSAGGPGLGVAPPGLVIAGGGGGGRAERGGTAGTTGCFSPGSRVM